MSETLGDWYELPFMTATADLGHAACPVRLLMEA